MENTLPILVRDEKRHVVIFIVIERGDNGCRCQIKVWYMKDKQCVEVTLPFIRSSLVRFLNSGKPARKPSVESTNFLASPCLVSDK